MHCTRQGGRSAGLCGFAQALHPSWESTSRCPAPCILAVLIVLCGHAVCLLILASGCCCRPGIASWLSEDILRKLVSEAVSAPGTGLACLLAMLLTLLLHADSWSCRPDAVTCLSDDATLRNQLSEIKFRARLQGRAGLLIKLLLRAGACRPDIATWLSDATLRHLFSETVSEPDCRAVLAGLLLLLPEGWLAPQLLGHDSRDPRAWLGHYVAKVMQVRQGHLVMVALDRLSAERYRAVDGLDVCLRHGVQDAVPCDLQLMLLYDVRLCCRTTHTLTASHVSCG